MATTAKKKAAAARTVATNKAKAVRADHEDEMEEGEEEIETAAFDYNAFFSEAGLKYTEDDLVDTGALMPIYGFEHAFEESWPPLFGLLVNRVEIQVDKANPDPKQEWRWFYVVEAEIATKALTGTKDDREVIDIEPGDYVLMPESGALKNRDRLKMAAVDPDFVHKVFFRVEGEPVDLGKPGRNPMWPIEGKLINDPLPRRGRYMLTNTSRERPALTQNGTAALPPGTVVNNRTGAVNERLVG